MSPTAPLLRIGELARRAGIPPATLRAWERRYGIVEPQRTDSGYRLYSDDDERRLKRMIDLITQGAAPAEAAAKVSAEAEAADPGPRAGGNGAAAGRAAGLAAKELRDEIYAALINFDEAAAHRAVDRAIAAYRVEALLVEVILPVLRRIGDKWLLDEATIGQEHFASNVIRGRLMALTRGWGAGFGPLALLACPPEEEHDLGLVSFGLLLGERGWRVALLGSDTPFDALAETAERIRPSAVVLAVTTPATAEALESDLMASLPAPLAIGGASAGVDLADRLGGARLLPRDIVAAADELTDTGSF